MPGRLSPGVDAFDAWPPPQLALGLFGEASCDRRQESRLNIGIVGVSVPFVGRVGGADIDALAQRVAGVGVIAEARDYGLGTL